MLRQWGLRSDARCYHTAPGPGNRSTWSPHSKTGVTKAPSCAARADAVPLRPRLQVQPGLSALRECSSSCRAGLRSVRRTASTTRTGRSSSRAAKRPTWLREEGHARLPEAEDQRGRQGALRPEALRGTWGAICRGGCCKRARGSQVKLRPRTLGRAFLPPRRLPPRKELARCRNPSAGRPHPPPPGGSRRRFCR